LLARPIKRLPEQALWKRGQRYGSIICDLERRCIVDLLPDREPGTVEAWLSRHPEIHVISRDRGGG